MRTLSIDRFDGNYAICEDDEKKFFAINKNELPDNAKEGDIIVISNDGEITVDLTETQRRRQKAIKMQNRVWE